MSYIKNLINEIEQLKLEQKYKEAIKILEQNIWKYHKEHKLYEELADIYLYMDEIKKAEKSVNFALKINKESPTWNYLKWFIMLSKNEVDQAIKFLSKSNSTMWNNAEVLRNLWWAYNMKWETEKWISILKRALNISPWDVLITEDLAMALISAWEIDKWNTLLKAIWKKIEK